MDYQSLALTIQNIHYMSQRRTQDLFKQRRAQDPFKHGRTHDVFKHRRAQDLFKKKIRGNLKAAVYALFTSMLCSPLI